MTVRARALAGKAAPSTGSGPHWSEPVGKQRLLEVMGRMRGEKHLLEKLLLPGLS